MSSVKKVRPVRVPRPKRPAVVTGVLTAALLVGLLAPAAQGQSTPLVPSKLQLDDGQVHIRKAAPDGRVQAAEIQFDLTYEWGQGAVATESTEIGLFLDTSLEGYMAILDKTRLQVNVGPQGGSHSEEVKVDIIPRTGASGENRSKADLGLVKVYAEAWSNGNVDDAVAESQQVVPLKVDPAGGPDGEVRDSDGPDAQGASTAGAQVGASALWAAALVALLIGLAVGAVVGRGLGRRTRPSKDDEAHDGSGGRPGGRPGGGPDDRADDGPR